MFHPSSNFYNAKYIYKVQIVYNTKYITASDIGCEMFYKDMLNLNLAFIGSSIFLAAKKKKVMIMMTIGWWLGTNKAETKFGEQLG